MTDANVLSFVATYGSNQRNRKNIHSSLRSEVRETLAKTPDHFCRSNSVAQDQGAAARSAPLDLTRQVETRRVEVDLLRIVAAVLLPPLGVFLQVGLGKHFWINILLTLLGYIPGIVHAVWVIAKY